MFFKLYISRKKLLDHGRNGLNGFSLIIIFMYVLGHFEAP